MVEQALSKFARVLLQYSLQLKKGDLFIIYGESVSTPLVVEAYRQALGLGAHPHVRIKPNGLDEIYFKEASSAQLTFVSEFERLEAERPDSMLYIWGTENTRALENISPKRISLSDGARRELFTRRLERIASGELRWCGTQYPTQADAQEAEMSLGEYSEFVFKSCLLHKRNPILEWKKLSARQEKLIESLRKYKEIRVVARDTDLKMSVEGRKWINCDGKENFPDGEIFTSPIEDSAEGTILFTFPAVHRKREAREVRLRFKSGKVVEARAAKGEDYLRSMLDMDEGARRIGEFSFGTNYNVQRFTRNTLFDEKIGGTIHIALGASLPESGGQNVSALHWDMVCDLRQHGEVYGNGNLIHKRGKFLIQ
ncbi:peptidase M29 [candidate division TA06 bacterium DG_26]|uniref:Peptidase M29 n=1 Tax=candidate division TA06 bacterium DG_26 TaxID=1703771 RepID=A0A0S7WKB5_UNCT6|nr:MAG: peptidase M29 [candidate division TA06 bacterium DG_26]